MVVIVCIDNNSIDSGSSSLIIDVERHLKQFNPSEEGSKARFMGSSNNY